MRSQSNTVRAILIRHGRSTFNEQGLYQGSSNLSVLTERGQATALRVGEFLRDAAIDVIYTSPLKRALQTTDAILNGMGTAGGLKQVKQHAALKEIDMHHWEGQTFQRVQESFPREYACWKERPHEFQIESLRPVAQVTANLSAHTQGNLATSPLASTAPMPCYPVLDLFDRAQVFWQEVLLHHQGQTIAIVSHGGTNRALICSALGISPAQFHRMQQSNCGISTVHFTVEPSPSVRLETLNLTTFLGEPLPKLKEGKQGLRLLLLPSDQATPTTIQSLTDRLQSIDLDFSITCMSDMTQAITDRILQHHPRTVQLHSLDERGLMRWQQTITTNLNHPSHLMTALVVAPTASLQQMLGTALTLPSERYRQLPLQPATLSILHYPKPNHPPVLQALNFGRTSLF